MHPPTKIRPRTAPDASSPRLARASCALMVALSVLLGAVPASAGVRAGVTPGSLADSIHAAAAEAKAQGLDVRVVEFSN